MKGKGSMKNPFKCLYIFITALMIISALCSCQNTINGLDTEDSLAQDVRSDTEPITEKETEIVVNPVEISLNFGNDTVYASTYSSSAKEGHVIKSAGWHTTDPIDVSDYYALSYELAAQKSFLSIAFLSSDGSYISGVGTTSSLNSTTVNGYVVVPDDAVYAVFLTFDGILAGNIQRAGMDTAYVEGIRTREEYEKLTSSLPGFGLIIACLGDSLTEGDNGTDTPGHGFVNYRNYPYFLSKITGATTVNYGKCGYDVIMFTDEYKSRSVDVKDADIILIMLGSNVGMNKNEYTSYKKLITAVQKDAGEDAVIILISPPHATEDKTKVNYGYIGNVKETHEKIFDLAEEFGVTVIDAFLNSPIQPENEDKYQPNDGLHMGPDGYNAFAEYIANELSAYINQKQ